MVLGCGALLAAALLMLGLALLAVSTIVASLVCASLLANKPGGIPVLVYHSVSPDASWLPWATNTSVRPETLRIHLKTLKKQGWQIIPTCGPDFAGILCPGDVLRLHRICGTRIRATAGQRARLGRLHECDRAAGFGC